MHVWCTLAFQGVEICPVQFGTNERSDRFWSELAYKTYSWKLELPNANDMRVVITVAIYRGKGQECLQVKHSQHVCTFVQESILCNDTFSHSSEYLLFIIILIVANPL